MIVPFLSKKDRKEKYGLNRSELLKVIGEIILTLLW
ncbi:hypothetical protein FHS70_001702 [Flammeovirga yaeyamensis]|nr:hypothetical protein [Flammeovirga yaeyamensis]